VSLTTLAQELSVRYGDELGSKCPNDIYLSRSRKGLEGFSKF